MKAPSTVVSARIRRSVLLALALTPLLLLTGTARRASRRRDRRRLGRVDLGEADEVTVTVVALLVVGVATLVVWLLVPPHHLGTRSQFTVAFVWAIPVADYLRHRRLGDDPL